MMKRIVSIFLVVLIVCAFCILFLSRDKKQKFTFWSIQLKPVYEKQILEIIDEFKFNHPDINVVWVDIPIQEAQKRTLASILSSTPPDLINLNPDFSVLLAQRGALEYFEEEETEQFQSDLLNKLKYNEKIYALPFYATSPTTVYNKKIYENCTDDSFITTYDELYKISPKLKQCSSTAVFCASLNENDTFSKILNKYNISKLEELNSPKAQEVFSLFDKMYKEGYMPKDTLSINHREVIEKYMSNKALVVVAGSNFIDMIKQNAPDIYKESEIAPQLTGDNSKYDVSLMNLIIPKKSKNKELAKEFAALLTNKDKQIELAKITNVLPANKYALEDEYFTNCSDDLVEKARCMSAKQLSNINEIEFPIDNRKFINETINSKLEEKLIGGN